MTIALVDYGAGNLTSVIKALKAVGAEVRLTSTPGEIAGARAVVVPGVGNFLATSSLTDDWRAAIASAIGAGMPMLGICLGLQWLFEGSAEAPDARGLGRLPGHCFRLHGDVKVPHVGWNTLALSARPSRLFAGVPEGASAYFTHSYAAPIVEDTMATTVHAQAFSSAIERDRVFGVQFHPEKSGATGLAILRNFMRVARGDV